MTLMVELSKTRDDGFEEEKKMKTRLCFFSVEKERENEKDRDRKDR